MYAMKYFSVSVICSLAAMLTMQKAEAYGDFSAVTKGVCASSNARQLLEDARNGDVNAMRQLGKQLIEGSAMKRDVKNGVLWLKKAVEAGDNRSMLLLGDLYKNGNGVKKSGKKALELYMAADKAGNKNASKRLKKMSLKEALPWWEARAKDGEKEATLKLLEAYITGNSGIAKNMEKALELYENAVSKFSVDVDKLIATQSDDIKADFNKLATDLQNKKAAEEAAAKNANMKKDELAGGAAESTVTTNTESEWEKGVPELTVALRRATAKRQYDKYEELIKAGADVNYRFSDGATALRFEMGAIDEGIDILLDNGADINNEWGYYCEHIHNVYVLAFYTYVSRKREDYIDYADDFMCYLHNKGVIFEIDKHGCLPLHYAASIGWPKYAKLAVNSSDVHLINKYGMTPLDTARRALKYMIEARQDHERRVGTYIGEIPIYNVRREMKLRQIIEILENAR